MLVLTRRADEAILLGDGIEIRVHAVRGSSARLSVRGPITRLQQYVVRAEQVIPLGEDIEVRVLRVHRLSVRMGIQAPRECIIVRKEVAERTAAAVVGV